MIDCCYTESMSGILLILLLLLLFCKLLIGNNWIDAILLDKGMELRLSAKTVRIDSQRDVHSCVSIHLKSNASDTSFPVLTIKGAQLLLLKPKFNPPFFFQYESNKWKSHNRSVSYFFHNQYSRVEIEQCYHNEFRDYCNNRFCIIIYLFLNRPPHLFLNVFNCCPFSGKWCNTSLWRSPHYF